MKVIETERVILREFTKEDTQLIFDLLNSPGWLKYVGTRGIKDLADAEKYIATMMMPGYTENGYGFYMMESKDGIQMGMCGLTKRDSLDDADIGFAILPQYEGKGFTTEAATATMDFAENKIGLKRISAITVPYNVGSIKILEKIGMKHEKMITMPNDPEELMLFVKEF